MNNLKRSPTWPYVLKFAKQMEAKLALNRHKGDREGWLSMRPFWLKSRIKDEMGELNNAFKAQIGEFRTQCIEEECADIANFAMMLADNERKRLRE